MKQHQTITIWYLETTHPRELNSTVITDPSFMIIESQIKSFAFNRFLYSLVGRNWHWADKLSWTDNQWEEYVNNNLRTWVAYKNGTPAGYYELIKSSDHTIEIAYFGLTPDFIRQGFGSGLLSYAIQSAWDWNAEKIIVSTCSEDHPNALNNYRNRGMRIYRETVTERKG
ncbi:hypothetical protein CI610_00799 [invertebrate metagenome]|uniref:N-acetyltransferase domain-containing protein n=1 Tax=invertebrate metagenome TaxID=1711999 RepID=A0A2H9TAK5_9ZZZZ